MEKIYRCMSCLDKGYYYLPDDLKPVFDAAGQIVPRIANCNCKLSPRLQFETKCNTPGVAIRF